MTFLTHPENQPRPVQWSVHGLVALIRMARRAKAPGYMERLEQYAEELSKVNDRQNGF